VDKEEFNRVDDLDVAKDVWITLQMAHEGSKPARKTKIECLRGNSVGSSCLMLKHLRHVQPIKEDGQQGKGFRVQEVE
jgi:hypothetical protein